MAKKLIYCSALPGGPEKHKIIAHKWRLSKKTIGQQQALFVCRRRVKNE